VNFKGQSTLLWITWTRSIEEVTSELATFYRVMLRRAWHCHGKSSVRLSIRDVEVS